MDDEHEPIPSILSEDDIAEILKTGRTRNKTVDVLREFLGLPDDWEPEPPSKKMLRKWRWQERRNRIRHAYQVLRRGYHDGEGDGW